MSENETPTGKEKNLRPKRMSMSTALLTQMQEKLRRGIHDKIDAIVPLIHTAIDGVEDRIRDLLRKHDRLRSILMLLGVMMAINVLVTVLHWVL